MRSRTSPRGVNKVSKRGVGDPGSHSALCVRIIVLGPLSDCKVIAAGPEETGMPDTLVPKQALTPVSEKDENRHSRVKK